jgi:hypothetical protein
MNNVDATRVVTNLIAGERLTTPSVKSIEPEVRSGGQFPFCDLLKHGENQEETERLLQNSVLLGALVIEWGYDIPFNKHDDFKKWLITNEVSIVTAQPRDVTYRGTYAVSMSSEKHSGLYRTIWAFRTLRALEFFDAEMHDPRSTFARLIADLNAFRDHDRGADRSQQIYQPVRCAQRFA